jgi:hypothetical protein
VELRRGVAVRTGFEGDLEAWLAGSAGNDPGAAVGGGRGTTRVVGLRDGGRAFVRRYRHGGLLGTLLRDLYWQRPPRPCCELQATEAARHAGVAAPEVLAAVVLPVRGVPCLYRAVLVTRALDGRRSLGDALTSASGDAERRAWIACAVRVVRLLHGSGIHHPDLNVANVLVGERPDRAAALIDFDRARVGLRPVGTLARALARRRLARSIAKLGLPGLDRAGAARALDVAGLGGRP